MAQFKFKINNSFKSPENRDYDILGLHKKRTLNVDGELSLVEYYKTYDGVTYSDLVVKEERIYTRNSQTGLVSKRDLIATWYLTDNSIGCVKKTEKYYTFTEAYEEGKSKRSNLINMASINYPTGLFFKVGKANAVDFLNGVGNQIALYINGSTQPLLDAINDSTKSYMSPNVKTGLTTILNR